MIDEQLLSLSQSLGKVLEQKKMILVTAESCTGGWVAEVVTSVSGSSRWFERGFVTYSDAAKQELLSVKTETLATHGAVSEETVREMAAGALKNSHGSISLAITGIAGPEGGSIEKPVGAVWFGFMGQDIGQHAQYLQFSGERNVVRYHAVEFALQKLLELLAG